MSSGLDLQAPNTLRIPEMLVRRVPHGGAAAVGCQKGLLSPNVRRLVGGFLIVVCLASAAGIPKMPFDAGKVLKQVDDAEPWRQIGQEEAADNDLLPWQQHKTGTAFADGEQQPLKRKPSAQEEDAAVRDDERDKAADAVTEEEDAHLEDDPSVRVAPKYMLELYRKFSNDKYSHPIANIVRSFLNINTGVPPIWTTRNRTRIALHTLLFNISSVNKDEEIHLAELRLYAAKKTQRVLVYEVVHQTFEGTPEGTSVEASPGAYAGGSAWTVMEAGDLGPSSRHYQLLTTREIPRGHGDWETFAVTEVVRRWVRTQATAGHILEVRVDTARPDDEGVDDGTAENDDAEGVAENGASFQPILVVFSNDRKRRKIELRELHDIQSHENGAVDELPPSLSSSPTLYSSPTSSVLSGGEEEEEEYDDEEDEDRDRVNATVPGGGGPDDGYYEKRYPQAVESLSTADRVDTPSASANRPQQLPRVRRSLSRNRRRRAKRNSCRRKPMWVDFRDVQWDRWIIEPQGYQAYECTGQCYFPVGENLTPTKYAMIKSLLHATYPKRVAAVCCVPTRLEPISLLYIDEHGTVTYKYKYDGMVVAECGCR